MMAILNEAVAIHLGIMDNYGPGYVGRALLEAIIVGLRMMSEKSHLTSSRRTNIMEIDTVYEQISSLNLLKRRFIRQTPF